MLGYIFPKLAKGSLNQYVLINSERQPNKKRKGFTQKGEANTNKAEELDIWGIFWYSVAFFMDRMCIPSTLNHHINLGLSFVSRFVVVGVLFWQRYLWFVFDLSV